MRIKSYLGKPLGGRPDPTPGIQKAKKPSFVFTMIPNHSSSRHGSQILLVP